MTDRQIEPSANGSSTKTGSRDSIAKWVIICSGVGIVAVAITVLLVSYRAASLGGMDHWHENSRLVFNTLTPIFATWVGTVIAYYFSRDNFESANQSVRQLVDRITLDEHLQRTPARSVMLSVGQMVKIKLQPDQNAEELRIEELDAYLDPDHPQTKNVTRLPILDSDDKAVYVIHRSVLFEHRAKMSSANPDDLLLRGLLARPRLKELVTTWANISQDATLLDAKRAMEASAIAQDVIVTPSGAPNDRVVGWLTNVDITRAIEKF